MSMTENTVFLRAFIGAASACVVISPELSNKALATVEKLEAEREHLLTCLGAIASECCKMTPDFHEIYHYCYLGIVKDLSLPAEEQAAMMQSAIDTARKSNM